MPPHIFQPGMAYPAPRSILLILLSLPDTCAQDTCALCTDSSSGAVTRRGDRTVDAAGGCGAPGKLDEVYTVQLPAASRASATPLQLALQARYVWNGLAQDVIHGLTAETDGACQPYIGAEAEAQSNNGEKLCGGSL